MLTATSRFYPIPARSLAMAQSHHPASQHCQARVHLPCFFDMGLPDRAARWW
ncbi:hypothetical protein COCVIDRAFT_99594 [Bipolaris victoriae FI3]|uniref:Uncharacterized protein n=2 Tax=Bipolaris TaxID=33194 RepID=W6YRH7_COCC2|nr:uncharacterized protein COCCADRAFT_84075 [Bipolaris zeicola 26-R-13]XP_014556558.1 hypothetical protein COCVIDRAFT_99594 [Bipolaris victoriae FI3]EUC38024.1 hypothetical protein COCCADRAFT_84075 [Bipolaris zeicola 26-R-13]